MEFSFSSDASLVIATDEVARLHRAFAESRDPRVLNLHPAYRSLQIDFDPRVTDPAELLDWARARATQVTGEKSVGRVREVPVVYGGDHGPDLEPLATTLKLSGEELIRLHSSKTYDVSFLGFSPGFPYLTGLDPRLHCRRKDSPRLHVDAGSVAIAGAQAGIYPEASPGGWQLLGRTNVRMFDPQAFEPSYLLPGDRVRFIPVKELEFKPALKSPPVESTDPVIEVLNPGTLASVQAEARYGFAHLGVSAGGAADPRALVLGNRLLGNDDFASAIEMTGWGGSFRFHRDTWFCIAGGECEPSLGGQNAAMWTTYFARAGETVSAGQLRGSLRAYLCVHGGLDVPTVLGSKSTLLGARFGGHEGRALQKGDLLGVTRDGPAPRGFQRAGIRVRDEYSEPVTVVRVTAGPQADWFTESSRAAFFATELQVSTEANRLGLRLLGATLERIEPRAREELLTEGIANGSIQIAAGGQPMILFCEQQTTGGYPKIANVISADLHLLGRLAPGGKFRCVEVSLEEAWRLARESIL